VGITETDTVTDMDTRPIPTPSLGTATATTRITGTRRDTSTIRGTSITGGVTMVMTGASIIGVIVGTIAMIGRAATAGVIVASACPIRFHARAHSCSVTFDAYAAVHA